MTQLGAGIVQTSMTSADFIRLSTFIYSNYGIKLPTVKKTMLEGRLNKRLKALNITSFKQYCDYVFSPEGKQLELVQMIDLVTTNKTDFFREPAHFDFLTNKLLPHAVKERSFGSTCKVWSAGCSSGEEPYTLAMVLSEFAENNPGFDYSIFGTDISSRALQTAATAVYTEEKVAPVPLALKRKYLLKHKDIHTKTTRIIPKLRARVCFDRLNFINDNFRNLPNFNIIFCRNVLIYFDRPTQEKVILKLCSKLKPGGFLFLGHSESISNMTLPLTQIQPTTFRKI